MRLYCNGIASIEHIDTGEIYEIHPDELNWETKIDSQKGMGSEFIYTAKLEHEELGDLTWTVSEYPEGAENSKETDVGQHILVDDFDYGLASSPDADPSPEQLLEWIEANHDWFSSLTASTQIRFLVEWFHHYFEDPAQETPYQSSEGGYLYIHGGPYDAMDQLSDKFSKYVSEEVIEAAVNEVQSDGLFDWAPTSNHPDRIAYDEEAMFDSDGRDEFVRTLEEIRERLANGETPSFGSDQERAARSQVRQKISEARDAIPPPVSYGSIGHNKPPDEFALQSDDLKEVQTNLDELDAELQSETPDVNEVVAKASFFRRTLGWAAAKLDLTVDEFCKSFGKTLGAAVAAGTSILFWQNLADLFTTLVTWLAILL